MILKKLKPSASRKKIIILAVVVIVIVAVGIRLKVRDSLGESVLRVGVVGDSISAEPITKDRVKSLLSRNYQVTYYNGFPGLRTDQQFANTLTAVKKGNIDILLVELGTNDAGQGRSETQMRADVSNFINQVKPYVKCINWYNVKTSAIPSAATYNQSAPVFNRVLTELVKKPGYSKLKLHDYAKWAQNNPAAYVSDGIHHTEAGQKEFAKLAPSAATSCSNQIN